MSEEKLTDLEQIFEDVKHAQHLIDISYHKSAQLVLEKVLKLVNKKIGEEIDEQSATNRKS